MIKVILVYSPAPRQVSEWLLELADESSVAQAIAVSQFGNDFPEVGDIKSGGLIVGVWGRKVALTRALKDNDRIEIYRSLRVDPKVARRERFNSQGVKRAGLFAKTRVGAKAGY